MIDKEISLITNIGSDSMNANTSLGNKRKRPRDRVNPAFHISYSSLKELNKIIIEYAKIQGSVNYKEFLTQIGMKGNLAIAHGFLVDMGIIVGDVQKSSTDLGRDLGRALINGTESEIIKCWCEVIEKNGFCIKLLEDIKQHGKIKRGEFQKRIFYFADYPDPGANYRVGANALIRIFMLAGYITKSGPYYSVSPKYDDFEKKQILINDSDLFVTKSYILALENITHQNFDVTRLVKYCNEINDNYRLKNYSSVIFLCRAVLDHCPPVFGFPTLESLSEQLPTRNSLKKISSRLNTSPKKIADHHIHKRIGVKEVLPVLEEIDFKNDMNFLIGRIVEELSINKL